MTHQGELPALSPELSEHSRLVRDALLQINTVQVRWSVFALNGLFETFLREHKTSFNGGIVFVDQDQNLGITSYSGVNPDELEQREGRLILGCSLSTYATPHHNFGNLLNVLKRDPTISDPRY